MNSQILTLKIKLSLKNEEPNSKILGSGKYLVEYC